MTFRAPLSIALALCAAGAAPGQSQPVPPPQVTGGSSSSFSRVVDGVVHSITITTQNPPPRPAVNAFTGAPYSGDQIEVQVRRLADGTALTQQTFIMREYRDSEGRTRLERFRPTDDPDSNPTPSFVEIEDPVANVQYRLEPRTKIARRWDMAKYPVPDTAILAPVGISHGEGLPDSPPPRSMPANYQPPRPSGPPPAPPPGAVQATWLKTEHLGTQTVDGITVEGTRTTNSRPGGFGSEELPTPVVTEQWTATDLRVTLISKTTDPRVGETTRAWLHLSREEPDRSLFQPPPGYRVVDEKAAITINHRVTTP